MDSSSIEISNSVKKEKWKMVKIIYIFSMQGQFYYLIVFKFSQWDLYEDATRLHSLSDNVSTDLW